MAIRFLNQDDLGFPILWTLMPEIDAFGLYTELSPRNKAAVRISLIKIKNSAAERTHKTPVTGDEFSAETVHAALRWMFDTGKAWPAPGVHTESFEAVIDYAAALLIVVFDDGAVLPDIVRLIFDRNRKGRYIHDLVWAFFQTLSPDALRLTADYLLSPDGRDVRLARSLLPTDIAESAAGTGTQRTGNVRSRDAFNAWLDSNSPYLYLTGEQYQQTSEPRHFDCDREAQYLGRAISPRDRTPRLPLTEEERVILSRYRALPEAEQALLASYSLQLHDEDLRKWNGWRRMEAAQQVMAAKNGYEVI